VIDWRGTRLHTAEQILGRALSGQHVEAEYQLRRLTTEELADLADVLDQLRYDCRCEVARRRERMETLA
jgi:hypothetical protein